MSLPSCALYMWAHDPFKTFKQSRYGKRAITCRESIDPNIDEVKARTPQASDGNHLQCLPPVIPKCDLQHKIGQAGWLGTDGWWVASKQTRYESSSYMRYLDWIFGIFARWLVVFDFIPKNEEESTHLDKVSIVWNWDDTGCLSHGCWGKTNPEAANDKRNSPSKKNQVCVRERVFHNHWYHGTEQRAQACGAQR